jgi:hypothetical protein
MEGGEEKKKKRENIFKAAKRREILKIARYADYGAGVDIKAARAR